MSETEPPGSHGLPPGSRCLPSQGGCAPRRASGEALPAERGPLPIPCRASLLRCPRSCLGARSGGSPCRPPDAGCGAAVRGGPGNCRRPIEHRQGLVAGRVTNAQTGAYLEGAEIRILELNRQAITDREGLFNFPRVAPGSYTLQVSYLGVEAQRVEITVRSEERTFVEVDLHPIIFRLDEMVIRGQIEGQAHAREILETARFPMIAANIRVSTSQLPEFAPYHILETPDGRSLAILGLSVIIFEPHDGLEDLDYAETVERYLYLTEEHDALILLTHIGIPYEIELANRFPELSAVIGGHTHTLLTEAIKVNGVLVAQAGGQDHRAPEPE